jgi:V8-like Glu-specific endopeptidase
MTTKLRDSEIDSVVEILVKLVTLASVDTAKYFNSLVGSAHVPSQWRASLTGVWTGNVNIDARALVDWALAKGTNPKDPRVTTVGALLKAMLPQLGLEERSAVAALIHQRRLFNDPGLLENLAMGYQVPLPAGEFDGEGDLGPDFVWHGPDDLELQSFWRPESEFLDVGFVSRAIQRASAVCRIEVGTTGKRGTGFLVGAKNFVLTNYHVVEGGGSDQTSDNAKSAVLRFGRITLDDGREAEGRTFKTDPKDPVPCSSPTEDLDFALVRVEEGIFEAETLSTAPCSLEAPAEKAGLHLLQHPRGDAMKIAFSNNGVTGTFDGRLLQYVTKSAVGSSGAPCFDDDWRVVALHHAQRSKMFGIVREGILLQPIYDQISDLVPSLG